MVDPDNTLISIFSSLPVKKRKRVLDRLRDVPENAKQLWSDTRTFYRSKTGEHFLKVRVDMLEAAKWDPAGWSVLEWERLPVDLRRDLDRVFPIFQKLIREEGEALLKQLESLVKS